MTDDDKVLIPFMIFSYVIAIMGIWLSVGSLWNFFHS